MNKELDKLTKDFAKASVDGIPYGINGVQKALDKAFQLGVKAVLKAQTEGVEELDSWTEQVDGIDGKGLRHVSNQTRTKMLNIGKGLLKV